MTLSDIQQDIYFDTDTTAVSFPVANQLIKINEAYNKVNAKIRNFLDNYFPTQFLSTDLSTGTAQPVFDPAFHALIPLYIKYDIAVRRVLPSAPGFLNLITVLERDLAVWYGQKNWQVCSVSIATPAVINKKNHGLVVNDMVLFQTTGALPTGLTGTISSTPGVFYYVVQIVDSDNFYVSATKNGTPIATTGTQSGQQYFSSDRDKQMVPRHHSNK